MCDVNTMAQVNAAALGSSLQSSGQQQAARARGAVAQQEVAAQQGYRQAAMRAAGQENEAYAPGTFQQSMADALARRGAAYREAATLPAGQAGYLPSLPGAGTPALQAYTDQARVRNDAFTGQQGDARANLGSWADALLRAGEQQKLGAGQIALQDSFARGSAGTLDARLQAAGQAGAGERALGNTVIGGSRLLGGNTVKTLKNGWDSIFGQRTPDWSAGDGAT